MPTRTFKVVTFLLLFARLAFLSSSLQEPHSWRQADTAHYIQDFYENGIDLFHPRVCWMGNRETLILEFPLPEALVSIGYHLFGANHLTAGGFFFLFFCFAYFFFAKLAFSLFEEGKAQVAILLFLLSPLGLFFATGLVIDTFSLATGLGAYYFVRMGVQEKRGGYLLGASLMTLICMLVKLPYMLVFLFPIFYEIRKDQQWKWVLKYWPLALLPLAGSGAWQWHTHEVNSSAPDWYFLPGYRKFILSESTHWYFGEGYRRLEWWPWAAIGYRTVFELLGVAAFIPAAFGFFKTIKLRKDFAWWFVGSLTYVLIFFNLNAHHSYYMLALVPLACFIGSESIGRIYERKTKLLGASLLLFALLNFSYAFNQFGGVNEDELKEAEFIQHHTEAQDLLVITKGNVGTAYPNLLYAADRHGWMVLHYGLSPEILQKLRAEGAKKFVIIGEMELTPALGEFLKDKKIIQMEVNRTSLVTIYSLI